MAVRKCVKAYGRASCCRIGKRGYGKCKPAGAGSSRRRWHRKNPRRSAAAKAAWARRRGGVYSAGGLDTRYPSLSGHRRKRRNRSRR